MRWILVAALGAATLIAAVATAANPAESAVPISILTKDSLAGTLDVRLLEVGLTSPQSTVPRVGIGVRLDGPKPAGSRSTIVWGGDRVGDTAFIAVEQLEVLKGPATALYGYRATTGVVRFVDRARRDRMFNTDVTLFDPYTRTSLWTTGGRCDGCTTRLDPDRRVRLFTFRNVLTPHKRPAICGRLDDYDFSSRWLAGTTPLSGVPIATATGAGIDLLCNWSTPRATRLRNRISPPGARPFTVTLQGAWAHGTGASNACGLVTISPARSGSFTATLEGEGRQLSIGPSPIGADGRGVVSWGITSFGVYDLDARVTAGGRTVTASTELTVTSAAGTAPWCTAPP